MLCLLKNCLYYYYLSICVLQGKENSLKENNRKSLSNSLDTLESIGSLGTEDDSSSSQKDSSTRDSDSGLPGRPLRKVKEISEYDSLSEDQDITKVKAKEPVVDNDKTAVELVGYKSTSETTVDDTETKEEIRNDLPSLERRGEIAALRESLKEDEKEAENEKEATKEGEGETVTENKKEAEEEKEEKKNEDQLEFSDGKQIFVDQEKREEDDEKDKYSSRLDDALDALEESSEELSKDDEIVNGLIVEQVGKGEPVAVKEGDDKSEVKDTDELRKEEKETPEATVEHETDKKIENIVTPAGKEPQELPERDYMTEENGENDEVEKEDEVAPLPKPKEPDAPKSILKSSEPPTGEKTEGEKPEV